MNKALIVILLLVVATACQNKKAAEEAAAAAAKATADSIAAVVAEKAKADSIAAAVAAADTMFWSNPLGTKLKAMLVANPTSQADIDKNIILTYAAKNNMDIKITKSGLAYIEETVGKGTSPKMGETVSTHYRGYFLDGREFDSSYKRGQPTEFAVGQVVDGWNEALMMMKPGGKVKLIIPSALGYKEQGYPGAIPGNTVLGFDLELLKVVK